MCVAVICVCFRYKLKKKTPQPRQVLKVRADNSEMNSFNAKLEEVVREGLVKSPTDLSPKKQPAGK